MSDRSGLTEAERDLLRREWWHYGGGLPMSYCPAALDAEDG